MRSFLNSRFGHCCFLTSSANNAAVRCGLLHSEVVINPDFIPSIFHRFAHGPILCNGFSDPCARTYQDACTNVAKHSHVDQASFRCLPRQTCSIPVLPWDWTILPATVGPFTLAIGLVGIVLVTQFTSDNVHGHVRSTGAWPSAGTCDQNPP